MNFQELIGKIADLDKPVQQLTEEKVASIVKSDLDLNAVKTLSGITESAVDECCGGPMGGPQGEPVTMNVSMNARGSESIRDLLDLLTGHASGGDSTEGPKGIVIGTGGTSDIDEKFQNEPEEEVGTVADVIPTGDDMASKGDEAEKVNGGGNPWRSLDETQLKQDLQNLYQEVKNR